MRAIVSDGYGQPETMRLEDVPIPKPGPGQVLVRIVATSVNLSDWECLVGTPAYARINRRRILGSDIAGVIAAVGPGVDKFGVGDEVYGDNIDLKGGFADFAVAPVKSLSLKPAELTFVQAAAIPQPAAIAICGMADVVAGSRVLINGAGGGSGAFAIQLAKAAGAHVTGVDNAGKLESMRALGADEVVDYRVTDPTRLGPFDLILDLVAHRSLGTWRRALAPGARYLLAGGSMAKLLGSVTFGPLIGLFSGRRLGVLLVRPGPASFDPIAARVASGEFRIPIERTFSLEDVPAALAHVGEGRALGKVVIEVA
jgi:NADPH:quinone reductase-like Zn-dependent oxidoreductase